MKRKITAMLLAVALCAAGTATVAAPALAATGAAAPAATTPTAPTWKWTDTTNWYFVAAATPTVSTVLVNGRPVAFDAYNISDNNYFKLRDLASVLSGTEKQFEVGWDGAANAIALTSGAAYTPVGGEMAGKGAGDKTPVPTTSRITLDGKDISFTAYNIDGNNYFKLRDIGAAFDFGVDWDGARNTIAIDTGKGYATEEVEIGAVEYITIKGKQYSTSLTELDLSRHGLTDADIEPLRHMTNLTALGLNYNQISDVGPLSGLAALTELHLDRNQISDVNPLSGLTNLRELWLDFNTISDVDPLSGLTNLKELDLYGNQINDIGPLSGLTALTDLYLGGNPLTDAQIAELQAALPDCPIYF
ncbi:MAG: leucine-rich repeat domain-containing protein [Clostridiales Family XIII bacterium]|nr:leucine-rich repeat domain-containing protein [Clostridiales Family XIII bacterium]